MGEKPNAEEKELGSPIGGTQAKDGRLGARESDPGSERKEKAKRRDKETPTLVGKRVIAAYACKDYYVIDVRRMK